MMMRSTAVAAALVTVWLLIAEPALGCVCAYYEPEKLLRRSDGAVIARLLAVSPGRDIGDGWPGGDSARLVYRTGRVFKGRPRLKRGRRLVVSSPYQSTSCALSSRVGELTGLFLHREDGRWTSDGCGERTPAQMRRLDGSGAAASGTPSCT
jgi:hypothetical protein